MLVKRQVTTGKGGFTSNRQFGYRTVKGLYYRPVFSMNI